MPLFSQFDTAAVLGSVMDPNRSLVMKAVVGLRNIDTGVVRNTLTDGNGTYQFLDVHVGRYRVTSESSGFKKLETAEFRADPGTRQRVDVVLQIGDAAQVVQVTSTSSPLQSESSERGEVIDHEEIVELPLNGRSSASLALLTPGVASDSR